MSTTQGDAQTMDFGLHGLLVSAFTQSLCIAAVWWSSKHTLKNYIAVSSLTPHILPGNPPPSALQPKPKGLKRIFSKQSVGVWAPVIWSIFYLCIFFVVPKFSLFYRDAFWTIMMSFPIAMSFISTFRTVAFKDTLVSFETAEHGEKYVYRKKYNAKIPGIMILAALSLTALSLAALAYGYRMIFAIPIAGFSILFLTNQIHMNFTTRHVVMILNGYIIACISLIALVVSIASLFDSGNKGNSKSPDAKSEPFPPTSPWVTQAMLMSSYSFPTSVPGLMLAMAMRYDYSKTISLPSKLQPGEAATIPDNAPSFPTPTFNAGILSLAALTAAWTIGAARWGITGADGALVAASIPVVTIALVLSVWSRGQLKDWWLYAETWTPLRSNASSEKTNPEDASAEKPIEQETDALLSDAK